MATYLFKSTDAGAPTLSGTAGDLANVLDKLLVDGYNTKTITITRSGTTATANCTSHGFVTGQRVVVSGADQTDYNIESRITVTDANNFTYQVANSPATPATGTISAKVAPLGWTTAYTGTNKRAYRQKAGTNQFYLRVDDTGTTSARVVGYESMTDVDTGTNAFPTNAQQAGGLYAFKSATANTTTRSWWAYSNGKFIYFLLSYNSSSIYEAWCFGDITTFVAADQYHTVMCAPPSAGSAYVQSVQSSSNSIQSVGCYIARNGSGASGAVQIGWYTPGVSVSYLGSQGAVGNNMTYPSPNLGGLLMGRVIVWDGDGSTGALRGARGWIPGLWNPLCIITWATGDTFSGAAGSNLDGREFEVRIGGASANAYLVFETTDTWD